MTIKTSTGLRNKLLDTAPLRTILSGGFIKLYSGAAPATADMEIVNATLLCTISAASTGDGLNFSSTASEGAIVKDTGNVWSGVNVAGGVATFYRHVAIGDTGALSASEARIQGNIAVAGGDMNFTSVALANGATQTLDYYIINLPTL